MALPKFFFKVTLGDLGEIPFQEVSGLFNTIKRETVVISLLDEAGAVTMVWTLANAFPVKISVTDLQADGNEIAVETLKLPTKRSSSKTAKDEYVSCGWLLL